MFARTSTSRPASQLRRERDAVSRVSAESIRANLVLRQHEENTNALPGVNEATLKYVFEHATSILATAAVRHKATEVGVDFTYARFAHAHSIINAIIMTGIPCPPHASFSPLFL